MSDPTSRRPAHPWLVWVATGLAALYATLWWIELYLYILALAAGTVAFVACVTILIIGRLARRRRPILRSIEIGATVFGGIVHLAAWGVMRTVNWC